MHHKWITVAAFTLPTEMHVARSKLEAEGIACQVQDELTVQTHNFYSNAIGGVKLKVQEKDVEIARSLLIEMGAVPDERPKEVPAFLALMDAFTAKIPLLKRLILELRIVIIFTLLISIIAFVLWWVEY